MTKSRSSKCMNQRDYTETLADSHFLPAILKQKQQWNTNTGGSWTASLGQMWSTSIFTTSEPEKSVWNEPASYTQLHVILRAEIERISLLLVPGNTTSLIVFSGHWWAAADGGHFPGRP